MEFSEALGNGEAYQLVKRLSTLKTEWHSEPSLRSLSPRIVDALMKNFAEIETTGAPLVRSGVLFFTLIPLGLVFVSLFDHTTHGLLKLLLPLFMAIPSLGGLTFLHRIVHRAPPENWRYTVYALTQTDDVRVLETLILATRYKWGRHPEVIKAINRLLEQVTEADAGLLSDRALQRLWTVGITWQTFAQPYNHAGAIRALRALAAVGNRATMARMERFAYSSEYFLGERYAKAATRDLLPLMETRLLRQQVPATLLRASDANNTQPETLLRAVAVSAPEPTTQLLRASTSERPETDA